MTIATIALALIAGSAGADEARLFELVPVPPEYAAPMPAGGGARHRQQTVPPPPPEAMPPAMPVRQRPIIWAAPPPPRPPRIATPLRPQNPGSWITNDDYPAAALRTKESGTVGFRLTIDETGRVTECDVTLSSGSAVLDATSCAIMRRRASFLPARDAAGNGIPATYSNRLRWEIPEDPVVPMASWSSTLRFTIGGDNQVLSCAYQGYAAPDLSERSPCLGISELPRETMRKLRGRTRGAVAIYIRYRRCRRSISRSHPGAAVSRSNPTARAAPVRARSTAIRCRCRRSHATAQTTMIRRARVTRLLPQSASSPMAMPWWRRRCH
jgi:TonB family protein